MAHNTIRFDPAQLNDAIRGFKDELERNTDRERRPNPGLVRGPNKQGPMSGVVRGPIQPARRSGPDTRTQSNEARLVSGNQITSQGANHSRARAGDMAFKLSKQSGNSEDIGKGFDIAWGIALGLAVLIFIFGFMKTIVNVVLQLS